MKILKFLISVVSLYIIFIILSSYFFPLGATTLVAVANIILLVLLLCGVLFLLLGGKYASPIKQMWRIISLIIGLSVITVILIATLGADLNIGNKFIENVVPFGKILGVIVEIIAQLDSTSDTSFLWSLLGNVAYLTDNLFKLLLSTMLYPIITKFLLLPFIEENDKRNRIFSKWLRKAIVSFFGAVITCYASMFTITLFGDWFSSNFGQIGVIINYVYRIVGIVGLIAVFVSTSIIPVKTMIIGSLIKMLTLNFACVFVVMMFQYKSNVIDIFMVILACIGICVICDVLFPEKEIHHKH